MQPKLLGWLSFVQRSLQTWHFGVALDLREPPGIFKTNRGCPNPSSRRLASDKREA